MSTRRDGRAVDDVLAQLQALRLQLSSDMSAMCAAIESGEPQVAADIVAADQAELAHFLQSAHEALSDAPVVVPLPARHPGGSGRWRRLLPLAPAAGLLVASAAAAAVIAPRIGGSAPPRPTATAPAASGTQPASPALDSFTRLESAVESHAPTHQVLAAAHEWHRHLAQLIATAQDHPAEVRTIVMLLQRERQLLQQHDIPGAGTVLAAAARLEQHLLQHVAPLMSALPLTSPSPSVEPPSAPAASETTKPATRTRRHHKSGQPTTTPSPSQSSSTTPPSWSPPWQPSKTNDNKGLIQPGQ